MFLKRKSTPNPQLSGMVMNHSGFVHGGRKSATTQCPSVYLCVPACVRARVCDDDNICCRVDKEETSEERRQALWWIYFNTIENFSWPKLQNMPDQTVEVNWKNSLPSKRIGPYCPLFLYVCVIFTTIEVFSTLHFHPELTFRASVESGIHINH